MNASTKGNVRIGMGFSTLQGTITHRVLFNPLGYLELPFLDESLGPIEFFKIYPGFKYFKIFCFNSHQGILKCNGDVHV